MNSARDSLADPGQRALHSIRDLSIVITEVYLKPHCPGATHRFDACLQQGSIPVRR